MKWYIIRDGVVICETSVPYPAFIIRDMKANGYTVKVEKDKEDK